MNIDFHYYATYVAARLAGYDFASAQTIAHGAQYVDDSDITMLQDSLGHYYITDFTPNPTVQSLSDMVDKNFRWSEGALNSIADIWVPFHFLPGNYGDVPLKTYSGPQSDSGNLFKWKFDAESAKQFKLLCQPNSLLVKSMINDIVINHRDKNYLLPLIGLRMHVLADTWAHMFYIGMPAWFTNDAGENVYKIKGETKTPVSWQRVWPWDDSTDIMEGESATPDALAYNSVVYLGHGRMGHLPDYPYLKYEYTPRWSAESVVKDNASYFMQAFKQLTMALTCIRSGTTFNTNSYAVLPASIETVIASILATEVNDQSTTWQSNIGRITINGAPLEVPEAYRKDKWLDVVMQRQTPIQNTDYYYFNLSAGMHLQLVRDGLSAYNIYVDSIPRENIVTTKFKCKTGKYIGPIDQSSKTQYFPQMQVAGIDLQIIKQTPKLLTSGDTVEIKTLEAAAGQYNFLGAWDTSTALYYYTREWDLSKQKWVIEKVDTTGDLLIRSDDQVRFKNVNFDAKPYMSTYDYWMGGTYLTTQANGTQDNAIWIMDSMMQFNMFIVTTDYFVSDVVSLDLSIQIHSDMVTYGLLLGDNTVVIDALRNALTNIGLGFIQAVMTATQKEQVFIQLEKIANYQP